MTLLEARDDVGEVADPAGSDQSEPFNRAGAQTIAEAGPDGHPADAAATNGAGEVAEEALVAL